METRGFGRGGVLDNKKEPGKILILKSDRRGSNPRSRPWQGRALPTTPLSHMPYRLKHFPQRQDIC